MNVSPLSFAALRAGIPFAAGALFIGALSLVVYSGGKRENIASMTESKLIAHSLRWAARPATNLSSIKIVSIIDEDLETLGRLDQAGLRDAPIAAYRKILEKALRGNDGIVVLTMIPANHFRNDQDITEIFATIDRYNAKNRVILGIPNAYLPLIDARTRSYYRIVEGEDCAYQVNLYCSIVDEWPTWMATVLAHEFWKDRSPYALSKNLPHVYGNVLLNLPTAMPVQRAYEYLESNDRPVAVTFIGPDFIQAEHFVDSKLETMRTRSATTEANLHGEPLHLFWAKIAYMFKTQTTIDIAPWWVSLSLTLILCLILALITLRAGASFALMVFGLTVAIYVMLNLILCRYLHWYIPVFDIFYGGAISVVAALFYSIAATSYRSTTMKTDQLAALEIKDLKQNFISLISHNLNTPVAKIKGLIDVMKMMPDLEIVWPRLNALVVELQLIVRTVLLTTSLEQRSLMIKTIRFAELEEVFRDLGIRLETTAEVAHLHIDMRFVSHLLQLLHRSGASKAELNHVEERWFLHIEHGPLHWRSPFMDKIARRFMEVMKDAFGMLRSERGTGIFL